MDTELVTTAVSLLQGCLKGGPPEIFIGDYLSDHTEEWIFYRILELQIEQCNAILVLSENGLVRPAYAVLRSVLENMATLVWLTLDVDRYTRLFEEEKLPNMKEILTRIGWEPEYDRTFRFLSKFVHSNLIFADFYKRQEGVSGFQKLENSEYWSQMIVTENELYVAETSDDIELNYVKSMTEAEIKTAYLPYLYAKTFDLTITGLKRLYGTNITTQKWWPVDTLLSLRNCVGKTQIYMKLCSGLSDIIWFLA
jgi:hypothetical protein